LQELSRFLSELDSPSLSVTNYCYFFFVSVDGDFEDGIIMMTTFQPVFDTSKITPYVDIF